MFQSETEKWLKTIAKVRINHAVIQKWKPLIKVLLQYTWYPIGSLLKCKFLYSIWGVSKYLCERGGELRNLHLINEFQVFLMPDTGPHWEQWRMQWKWKQVKLLSRVQLFATPWNIAHQSSPSMEFSRQEYCSGLPFPSPGDLPDPGMEPGSPMLQADPLSHKGIPWKWKVDVIF